VGEKTVERRKRSAFFSAPFSYNLVRPSGTVPLASQQADPPTAEKLGAKKNASYGRTIES
jgi:hypothetical protein